MNIKEVFHILETEKFSSDFNKTVLYNKVMLIKLRKSFSEYFFISEDSFCKTNINALFFNNLILHKKNLDIEEVKMDIYNKIPDLTLSIKYLEPLDVIKEIKDNMNNDIKILKNKIYTANELSNIFNISIPVISNNDFLSRTAIRYKKSLFWIGEIIIKNLNKISQKSLRCLSVNKDIVPLRELSKILYPDSRTALLTRIKNKGKIFGVDLYYTIEEKDKNLKQYFIKNSDFKKILNNKKYYIKTDILRKEYNLLNEYEKTSIKKYHDFIFNKQTCLVSGYVKKETASNIIEILNLYKNNYTGFIDKLYNFINKSKNKFFMFSIINGILPAIRFKFGLILEKVFTEFKIEVENDKISKKDVLKILDYLKSTSYKYKKQGETNG